MRCFRYKCDEKTDGAMISYNAYKDDDFNNEMIILIMNFTATVLK